MERRRSDLEALFERDHTRLLALLDDVAALCARGSYVPAAKVFGEFRRIQERHLARETEALQKLVDAGGCPASVAASLREEHTRLTAAIDAAWAEISGGDHRGFEAGLGRLTKEIAEHELREKSQLLTLIRRAAADPAVAADVVHRLIE